MRLKTGRRRAEILGLMHSAPLILIDDEIREKKKRKEERKKGKKYLISGISRVEKLYST